jgi:hypothetical protein
MICPKCKKQETTEVKINKQHKDVQRERYCSGCDFSFSTVEKIKSYNKRKPRLKKLLMNYRFYMYGLHRVIKLAQVYNKITQNITSKNLNSFDIGFVMNTGKSGIYLHNKKSKKTYVQNPERKKQTIENIISHPSYWTYKNSLFNKEIISESDIEIISKRLKEGSLKKWRIQAIKTGSIEEKNLADIVWKELEEFHKSVSTYIHKEEFNREFFINYKLLEDLDLKESNKEDLWKMGSDLWRVDEHWKFYLASR